MTGGTEAAPFVQVAQGYDLLGQGRPEAALAAAEAARRLAPDLADAFILGGAAMKAMGRFADAVEALRAGLLLDPTRGTAFVSLAHAHTELGEWAAAEAALRRALAVDPRSVGAHLHLAEILARAGDAAAARSHREAAFRRQNLFVEPATRPAPTALVLATAEDGNIPLKYLLSRDRYNVVRWLIAFATPGQAGRLPRHDFVLNAIGEPEVPAETHAAVEAFRIVCRAPFLNRPDAVARTSRSALPGLLGDLPDVVVPPSLRWRAGEAAPGLCWPAIVRPVGSHGGVGLVRVDDAAAFVPAHPACDVTSFVDFASADGRYRKYRAIFVDRRPFPYHLAIGEHWLVHYISTNMLTEPGLRAEEARFLDDPAGAVGARAWAAVAAIGARLDLDYAGIDFSVLPDGRVLVFEANATMVVHPETEGSVLAYKNPAVGAILAAFDAMVG